MRVSIVQNTETASKGSFGVERGCGLYCGAGAESGFR